MTASLVLWQRQCLQMKYGIFPFQVGKASKVSIQTWPVQFTLNIS